MKTLIIAILYKESYWNETLNCLKDCSQKVVLVDRDGVGSMAGAYNHAFNEHAEGYDYVWFVSNITFKRELPGQLEYMMNKTGYAAIHPVMDNSDHQHMRRGVFSANNVVTEVPFVEFTAPMVRVDVFKEFQLDEEMPYVGHDMDFGCRVREDGYKIGVHQGTEVAHTYLRHSPDDSVTMERKRLRKAADQPTITRLIQKYGPNYKDRIKYFNKLES